MLLTTERDPANHVKVINLATSPATVTTIANVPTRPSQAVPGRAGPGEVLVCSDSVISKLGMLPYTAAGPILLGFGRVPVNRISQAPLPPKQSSGDFSCSRNNGFSGDLHLSGRLSLVGGARPANMQRKRSFA